MARYKFYIVLYCIVSKIIKLNSNASKVFEMIGGIITAELRRKLLGR